MSSFNCILQKCNGQVHGVNQTKASFHQGDDMFRNWAEIYVFAMERQKEILREAENLRRVSALRKGAGRGNPRPRGWIMTLMSLRLPFPPVQRGTAWKR